jgi:hypothetical protein
MKRRLWLVVLGLLALVSVPVALAQTGTPPASSFTNGGQTSPTSVPDHTPVTICTFGAAKPGQAAPTKVCGPGEVVAGKIQRTQGSGSTATTR